MYPEHHVEFRYLIDHSFYEVQLRDKLRASF